MADPNARIVQLKITLAHIDPPVWRRVRVPEDFPLRRLHDVIQAVFDWLDYHLHEFEVGEKLYGQPEIEGCEMGEKQLHSDRNVKLGALIGRGVERFLYRYDLGDDWEHIIEVEEVIEPDPGVEYPVLVDGARAAPPEDCGGPPGFQDFLEAMADKDHEEHESLTEWYGDAFDPEDMNLDAVEAMLSRIRGSRRKGPAKGSAGTRRGAWVKIN